MHESTPPPKRNGAINGTVELSPAILHHGSESVHRLWLAWKLHCCASAISVSHFGYATDMSKLYLFQRMRTNSRVYSQQANGIRGSQNKTLSGVVALRSPPQTARPRSSLFSLSIWHFIIYLRYSKRIVSGDLRISRTIQPNVIATYGQSVGIDMKLLSAYEQNTYM